MNLGISSMPYAVVETLKHLKKFVYAFGFVLHPAGI